MTLVLFSRWLCNSDVFDFTSDIDLGQMAGSLAKENWTKNYLHQLKRYDIIDVLYYIFQYI